MARVQERVLAISLIVFMLLTDVSAFSQNSYAKAAKKPAKTKITSCKADGNKVRLKWKKVKNAKAYRLYVQTGGDKWKLWKKVKKNAKNKKKYSDKFKYKLKKAGKKYKVYKQQHKFKIAVKKTKKTKYTYEGKYDTVYRFVVRSIRGKKLSKYSKVKKVRTPVDPASVNPGDSDNPVNPDDSDGSGNNDETVDPVNPGENTYTITYVLNGGTNDPANPSTYKNGDTFEFKAPKRENYEFYGWFKDKQLNTEITGITPSTKGNLTLYAKWHLEALNIEDDGMEDMIWSWWYYPQVITEGTSTFWGYATKEGYCGVAQYDTVTNVTKKTNLKKADTVDDHNGLAIKILKNKKIMCVYAGGHNSDKEIHIRISDRPLDISSFGKDIILESVGATCYGQIIESNGLYYLFYRVNNNSWAYRTSPDGEEWSDEVILVKTVMQYYCKLVATTQDNLIRILMYSNPTSNAPEIRMGFLNTNTNIIYDADAKTEVGTEMLDYQSFKVLQDVDAGKTQRLLDAAITEPDKPRFLIAKFTPTKNKNDSEYYLYDVDKLYKICDGGNPIWDPKYQLGAAFIGNNRIASIRNQNGLDYVEIYKFNGSEVSLTENIFKRRVVGSKRCGRPIVDINGRAFLWHYGYYNKSSYKDFDTQAVLYLIERDRIIGAPEEEPDPYVPGETEFTITYELNGGVNNPKNPSKYTYGDSFEFADPVYEGYEFRGWYTDSKFTQRIKEITPDTAGALKLYAYWYPKEMYKEDADTVDMIWSWWASPLVVRDGDKTFWTYTSSAKFNGIACYNDKTGKVSRTILSSTSKMSDTYAPSLILMKDKRIMCVYANDESSSKKIHVRISDRPLDISSFSKDIVIHDTDHTLSNNQIVESNGRYYMFYRLNGHGSWSYRYTTDGENWSDPIIAVSEPKLQYYCRFVPTTDSKMIRILMQPNTTTKDESGNEYITEIRSGFLNTDDNCIYDADGSTYLGDASVPYTKFQVIQDKEPGKTQRLLDAAVTSPDKPRFVFSSITDASNSTYYIHDSGRKYKICDAQLSLQGAKFPLGAWFAGTNKVVTARNADKTNGKDIIELYDFDGSKVSLTKEIFYTDIKNSKPRLARPIADSSGNSILWHMGRYTSAESFDTNAVLYLVDKDKLIGLKEDPIIYNIKYELYGGKNSVENPSSYEQGMEYTLTTPTRDGYTFKGWYTDAEFTSPISVISADMTGDLTLYAKWEEIPSYSITYVLYGGVNSPSNPSSYRKGDSITLKNATRDGFVFKGWFTDSGFTRKIESISSGMTGNLTLYAKWEEPDTNDYPITYVLNGGVNNDDNPAYYRKTDTIQLKNAVKEGSAFCGWYRDASFTNRITVITGMSGPLTLYAKWDDAVVTSANMTDMTWFWWTSPQVATEGSKTFWTYNASDKTCGIACYDETTKTVTRKVFKTMGAVSDTNTTAVIIRKDKRIMCVDMRNSESKKIMYVRISKNPLDISSFDTYEFTSSYLIRYPQLMESNGKYYVFYKANDNGSWAYRSSSDGITWSSEKIAIYEKTLQYYCRFVPTTNESLIRIVMQSNVDAESPDIRMGFFNTNDNCVYDADGLTLLGQDRVSYTDFTIMQAVPTGKTQRLLDVAVTAPEEPRFIFTTFTFDKSIYDDVYYLYNKGTNYTICDGGKHLQDPRYQLGATFAGADNLVVARNSEGQDHIEVYDFDGSKVSFQKELYSQSSSGSRAARPIADVSGNAVMWHVGRYSSSTSFETSAMLQILDTGRIVKSN